MAERRGHAAAPGRDVERRGLRGRRAAAGHRPRLHQRVSRADESRLGKAKTTWTVTVIIITCDESHTFGSLIPSVVVVMPLSPTQGEGLTKSQFSLPKIIKLNIYCFLLLPKPETRNQCIFVLLCL